MSIKIKSFKLKESFRGIKPFELVFKPGLNVIVGDNGAGKSTLLRLIEDEKMFDGCELCVAEKGVNLRMLDTEKNNPRTQGYFTGNIAYEVGVKFQSHGEVIFPLVEAVRDFKNILVLLDEPESGVSLKNQLKLVKALEDAVKNRCQVIVSSHSYPIILKAGDVFNMDSKTWEKSEDFLKKSLGGLFKG